MREIKFHKIICLFLYLCLSPSVNIYAGAAEEGKDLSRAITFRVYHLFTSIDEALREKKDSKDVTYSYFPCQKNEHCQWISKPKSVTAPHAWTLVSQGLGRELAGEDESERNKGEHWVYDIPAEASGCGQHFAIVWGMGEFFKSKKHTRPKLSGEGACEYWSIDEQYGDQAFGYEVVRNLVEKPDESETNGRLEGKPFIRFCSNLKGADFCSVTMTLAAIDELPALCARLWRYRNSGSRELYKTIYTLAGAGKHEVMDVTDDILAHRPDSSEEKTEEDEGEEFDVKIDGKDKKAVRVFGRFLTFEGFEEYIEKTKREVQDLIRQGTVALPEYDEKVLKDAKAVEPEEEEGETEEEDMADSSSGKKKKVKWEERYNATTAENKGYVLLDQKLVSNIEICDLWVQEAQQLVHVKIGTDSAVLNHLFGQGYASAKLLAHEDFSEKVILELIRREVISQMRKKIQAKFAAVKDGLWKEFLAWREKNKKKLEEKYGSKKESKIRDLIAKAQSKEKNSVERLAALKALHKGLKGEDKEELGKILEAYEKEGSSAEDDIAAFLTSQLKKTATLLDMSCFPEDKNGFQKFCSELRAFIKEDAELKKLVDDLERYRIKAIEGHLKNCWNKNEADMKTNPKGSIKASPPKFLMDLSNSALKPADRCKIIFDNFVAKYRKLKQNKSTSETHFSEKDLQEILALEDIKKLYAQLYLGFIHRAEDPRPYQVVYAIITDKDPTDSNILPLGARINLLRVAQNIKDIEGRKKFLPVVQIIPDVTKDRKPARKKAVEVPSFTFMKAPDTAAAKPPVKGAAKKGAPSSAPVPPAPVHTPSFDHPRNAAKFTSPTNYLKALVNYGTEPRPVGLQDDYVLCPTKGDGDCFFHALFTEPEEDLDAVTAKAAVIRDSLRETVEGNAEYIAAIKHELVGQYELYFLNKQYIKIPVNIRRKLQTNDDYTKYRLSIFGIAFPEGHPLKLIQENGILPFNHASLLMEISDEAVLAYLEDYKSEYVGQEKAYVQIPTGRDLVSSLGDIICKEQHIYAHCFMYDRKEGRLDFKGSLGDPTSTNIRYVLQDGLHYWALYRGDFAEAEKTRLEQIAANDAMVPAVTGVKRPRPHADKAEGEAGEAEAKPSSAKQPKLSPSTTDEEDDDD